MSKLAPTSFISTKTSATSGHTTFIPFRSPRTLTNIVANVIVMVVVVLLLVVIAVANTNQIVKITSNYKKKNPVQKNHELEEQKDGGKYSYDTTKKREETIKPKTK